MSGLLQVTTVEFRNCCGELVPPYPGEVGWRGPLPFNVSNFVGPLTNCHILSSPRNRKVNGSRIIVVAGS